MANILQRYGYIRHLNFVLPRKRLHAASYNYLNKPGEPLTARSLIPPPAGQHYDLLWNHGIYNSTFIHSIMPLDAVYITMLRQPLQQFVSAFEYYGNIPGSYINAIMTSNVSNPLAEYLGHPALYESTMRYLTYLRNKQAEDLGMEARHVTNLSLRRQYIQQLAADFHLVMITEFFDESLVLLRRLLCWDVQDVLYLPKNRNHLKKERNFSAEHRRQHRLLSIADYDLYHFFYQRFILTMKSQEPDFQEEVRYFKELLGHVQTQCVQEGEVTVNRSQWHAQFTLTPRDCQLMQQSELPFLDDIIMDALMRYHLSVKNN